MSMDSIQKNKIFYFQNFLPVKLQKVFIIWTCQLYIIIIFIFCSDYLANHILAELKKDSNSRSAVSTVTGRNRDGQFWQFQ